MPEKALEFSFVRSSGPGGQNVNKLSTKAVLRLSMARLPLSADTLARLAALAGHRLTASGDLLLSCDQQRSQEANRQQCLDDLRQLLVAAARRPKKRRPTKPSFGSKLRRLDAKKRRSDIKRNRGGPRDA